MRAYLDLVRHVLEYGESRTDRTGTGTLSVFGAQARFDLREGFPLLTTKKVNFPSVVRELLWFLRGKTNIHDGLLPHTHIWDAWADQKGDLGPIYGAQWRSWGSSGIDQLGEAIRLIREEPDSRRIVVSAWNVADLPKMRLQPCHVLFQFSVREGSRLDLHLFQRSADLALGVPFNIASYSLLLMIVAQETHLKPGVLIHSFGDLHIYSNHVDGLRQQLDRKPLQLPTVEIATKPWTELDVADFSLQNYIHHSFIRFEVAV